MGLFAFERAVAGSGGNARVAASNAMPATSYCGAWLELELLVGSWPLRCRLAGIDQRDDIGHLPKPIRHASRRRRRHAQRRVHPNEVEKLKCVWMPTASPPPFGQSQRAFPASLLPLWLCRPSARHVARAIPRPGLSPNLLGAGRACPRPGPWQYQRSAWRAGSGRAGGAFLTGQA